ncbi:MULTISPECIES: hypothetical protein [unclassified Brevundimonas]|uniref:hypothetical protein n=1 Tax=unclassified Brevundimonas TaxID=2622653 RepID=UPI000CFBACCC|nr:MULTISPECIES: hypothetical protein [unclassified Brevundimonas]PRA36647.1 hypothetical protein CQ024_00620 [Brevundimonas sp. MYb27]PQZ74769.1 hypothetical protein CQ026_15395 [Brevundimonas sp. MYb31]PRB12986.1 hypothetical protein CQ039_13635 [Brevundimonas sp. MYb52]PRB33656.1 hypothetical protein CQ035_12885 [Brevundimonas sp. MYb46]PRB48895.1 hypothetical protein CQ028_08915 [Brevundimonas sp. MYb33]
MTLQLQADADFPQMRFGEVWLDVDWEAFQVPRGSAPAPPDRTINWSQGRTGRLGEFLRPAGGYNPRIRISQVPDSDAPGAALVDAYEFIDRAWLADELPLMIKEAERILARTGFVTHYGQHFLVQRAGAWFIFADPGMPIDRGAVEERYAGKVVFADPTRFDYLPEAIADAAGGDSGRLAWAMEVMRRSKRSARFDRSAELEVSPVGRIGDAFRRGRPDEAAAHLSWWATEIYRTAWNDGAYFEGVRVSDAIAQERKEEASAAQMLSDRSREAQRRRVACAKFIAGIDPDGGLSAADLARLVHQARAANASTFAGIRLMDSPRETAKEIAQIRKETRRKAAASKLHADLKVAVEALLEDD